MLMNGLRTHFRSRRTSPSCSMAKHGTEKDYIDEKANDYYNHNQCGDLNFHGNSFSHCAQLSYPGTYVLYDKNQGF